MESLLIWATYQIHIIVSESALGFPEAGSCSDFPRCTQSIAFEYNKFAELVWCAVLCLVAQSCLTLWDLMHYKPPGSFVYGDSSGKNTGVGCHVLQQGIFPTQGSHCRRILYHLSHQGSPRKMKWVAYPFSRETSWSKNWTRVYCNAGRFFTSWVTREAQTCVCISKWSIKSGRMVKR